MKVYKFPFNEKGTWFNAGNNKYEDTIPNFNVPAYRTKRDHPATDEAVRRRRAGEKPTKYWSTKFQEGYLVCQMARECTMGCYARHGLYNGWMQLRKSHLSLDFTRHPGFVDTLCWELANQWKRAKYVRIHTSGEFYDKAYFMKWVEICRRTPGKKFWVYTKMVRMVKSIPAGKIPPNLLIIFSYGGHEDRYIDRDRDRHSCVFPRGTDPSALGEYVDCTLDDSRPICEGGAMKIGLIMHGDGPDFKAVPKK